MSGREASADGWVVVPGGWRSAKLRLLVVISLASRDENKVYDVTTLTAERPSDAQADEARGAVGISAWHEVRSSLPHRRRFCTNAPIVRPRLVEEPPRTSQNARLRFGDTNVLLRDGDRKFIRIKARFDSECASCGHWTDEGAEVVWCPGVGAACVACWDRKKVRAFSKRLPRS